MCLAAARVALRIIFKAGTELRIDFRENKCKVHEVGYTEESVISKLDMIGVLKLINIRIKLFC